MDSRSQVTLFLMLGMVLLIALSFALFIERTQFAAPNQHCESLAIVMETHLSNAVDDCLVMTGMQAGRFKPDWTVQLDQITPAYGYLGGVFLPVSDEAERQINLCIQETFLSCVSAGGRLGAVGCDLTIKSVEPDTVIASDDVSVTAALVFEHHKRAEFAIGPVTRDLHLKDLHDHLTGFLDAKQHQRQTADFNLDRLSASGTNSTLLQLPGGDVLHWTTDRKSRVVDQPFEFLFAASFTTADDDQ